MIQVFAFGMIRLAHETHDTKVCRWVWKVCRLAQRPDLKTRSRQTLIPPPTERYNDAVNGLGNLFSGAGI